MKELTEVRAIRCRIAKVSATTPDTALREVIKLRTSNRAAAERLSIRMNQIETHTAELELAADEAAKHGMFSSGATLRNRAAGLRLALKILTTPLPETP